MRTTINHWFPIVPLLLAPLFWAPAAHYRLALNVLASAVAVTLATEALQEKQYRRAARNSVAITAAAREISPPAEHNQ